MLTRRVVRAAPPEKLDEAGRPAVSAEDFDRALERVRRRHSAGAERFEDALERERRKPRDLDDLLRRADDGGKSEDQGEPPAGPRSTR